MPNDSLDIIIIFLSPALFLLSREIQSIFASSSFSCPVIEKEIEKKSLVRMRVSMSIYWRVNLCQNVSVEGN